MNKKVLIIASAGQLLNSKVDSSVKSFAQETGCSEKYTKAMMVIDQFFAPWFTLFGGVSYIDSYKKGKIDDEQFSNGIRDRLGVSADKLPDDKLKESWNKMCKFSDDNKSELSKLFAYLKNNPDKNVVLVNETNKMHTEYINQQLKGIGGYDAVKSQLIFVNSHKHGFMGKGRLAKEGVALLQTQGDLPQNSEIKSVYSLHKAIPAEGVFEAGHHVTQAIKTENVPTGPGDSLVAEMERIAATRTGASVA